MKFTIEIEDFYLSEDDNLEEGLKEYIKKTVFNEIMQKIKEKVDKEITSVVHKIVSNNLTKKIGLLVSDVMKVGKISNDIRYSKKGSELTIEEYIKEYFENKSGHYSSFPEVIEKKANAFIEELKKRYDLAFATHIIDNMQKAGLLKDENVKKLLEDNGGK